MKTVHKVWDAFGRRQNCQRILSHEPLEPKNLLAADIAVPLAGAIESEAEICTTEIIQSEQQPRADSGVFSADAAQQLNEVERAGILRMREEEKLSRDVYLALAEQFDVSAFSIIAASESNHMQAVYNLIVKYGLEDPVKTDEPGQFTDPEFVQLYPQLVRDGSENLLEAYRVGVRIEETDIADLTQILTGVTHNDVRNVFEHLMAGSSNHLATFTSQLQSLGDVNGDQLIDANDIDDLYAAIRQGNIASIFDLTGDGLVDGQDVTLLIEDILGTFPGDADLDGTVAFSDFVSLADHFGETNDIGWEDGDFDGDGHVDFSDFVLLAENFGL